MHAAANTPAAISKANATRLKNGTTTSKAEREFIKKLIIMGIEPDDIIYPYVNDPRYLYNCDCYIKSKDLFIEYQGHESHGYEPWTGSDEQIKYLIKKQDQGKDMTTWLKRDPKKLKTALDNKINLVLVYPKHKTYLIKDGKITTINTNDINKI